MDVSTPFYNYLKWKFGSEKEVRIRRLLHTIPSYVSSNKIQTLIPSGSKGEGLDFAGSDDDIMILCNTLIVKEENDNSLNTLILCTENSKSGFAQLKFAHSMIAAICNLYIATRIDNHIFLSATRCKRFFYDAAILHGEFVIHGPCVSDKDENVDYAFSVRCKSWIKQARPWLFRKRNWPTPELANEVKQGGVLFVPIGSKSSSEFEDESVEWRISFSIAEKQLIYSFNHTQLMSYALMKILLKEIIQKNSACEGLLCSYFMKTIVFWVSEEVPLTFWKPENIVNCFMYLLDRLIYCVEYEMLPHYFIVEINLFESRFSSQDIKALRNVLLTVKENGIFSFKHSDTLCDFFRTEVTMWENFKHDIPDLSKINIIDLLVCSIDSQVITCLVNQDNIFKKMFLLQTYYKMGSGKYVSQLMLQRFARSKGKCFNINNYSHNNKYTYIKSKKYFANCCIGLGTDSMSGWLNLATYYYCSKRWQLSLKVLQVALQNAKPNLIFTKKKPYRIPGNISNICDTLKHQTVELVTFTHFTATTEDSAGHLMFPSELYLILHFAKVIRIPPVVYAHFLRFLCFHNLHDKVECYKSIHDLEVTIHDVYLIPNERFLCESYICLGVALQVMEDVDGAQTAFIQAKEYVVGRSGMNMYLEYMLKKS